MNKKLIVYKLTAFVVLCFTSFIIKSETGCSTAVCKYISKVDVKKNCKKIFDNNAHDDYKKDFFIIKI